MRFCLKIQFKMKNVLLSVILFINFNCNEKIEGTFKLFSYEEDGKEIVVHPIEQYYTFKDEEFGSYTIENGIKVVYEDLNFITYTNKDSFFYTNKQGPFTFNFKYKENRDTLYLEDLVSLKKMFRVR